MEINILKLNISLSRYLKKNDSKKIRGYLGNIFWEDSYAHHHKIDGSLIYKYPCVQYKVINGSWLLIGFNKGLDIIKNTFNDLKSINIDGKLEEIFGKGLESYTTSFSISSEQLQYQFLTSWLALNEENYERYKKLQTRQERKELLKKILVGNIISMSKSLGYTVPEIIKADIINFRRIRTSLKGTPMLGFLGTFKVNFEIPDYWGIGKSVSRGFGTVKRI